jgi:hypothetical protein
MAKRGPTPERTAPITRDDLERGFLNIQSGVRKSVKDRKSTIATVAGGAGLLLVVIVFLIGRRSGKKTTTFVEIRRV